MKELTPNARNIANLIMKNLSKKSCPEAKGEHSEGIYADSELAQAARAYNNTWYYELHRPLKSIRTFGSLIVFCKKVVRKLIHPWLTKPLFEDQIKFNSSSTWALNEVIKVLEKMNQDITIIKQRDETFKNEIEQIFLKIEEISQELKIQHNLFNSKLNKISNTQELVNNDLDRLKKHVTEGDSLPGYDYLLFENKYRGSRTEIKRRQSVYLPYFSNETNVLDIGCGRGEFLELLTENSISVKGIDINEQMVEFCKDAGLNVDLAEAEEYMEKLADNSLGGIFLGQVIEHLKPGELLQLVKLAHKKLKSGACLIMETPDPTNLRIFSTFFYQDLTHLKPVHPETLRFLLESTGFQKHETLFLSPTPEDIRLQLIDDIQCNSILNDNFEKLNNLLFGFQDYAVVGWK